MSNPHRNLNEQLQAICEKHGCLPGMVRHRWIDQELTRRADEINRLRKIIKEASEVAGMGRRREACEMLHAEIYPGDE